jgi:hypothetical protein
MNLYGVTEQLVKILAGDQERKEHRTGTDGTNDLFVLDEPLAKQPVDNRTEQREEGYKPQFIVHLSLLQTK